MTMNVKRVAVLRRLRRGIDDSPYKCRDKEIKGKDTDGVLEKEKERHEKGKGREGRRFFAGSMRRINLISVGVLGKQTKTKSDSGDQVSLVLEGGGSLECIPLVPTLLPSASRFASQASLKILPSTNVASGNVLHL
jgi:hypothetical protein